MPRPYSEGLRWQAIWMKEILGFQVNEATSFPGSLILTPGASVKMRDPGNEVVNEVGAALWMSPRTIERYVRLKP